MFRKVTQDSLDRHVLSHSIPFQLHLTKQVFFFSFALVSFPYGVCFVLLHRCFLELDSIELFVEGGQPRATVKMALGFFCQDF